LTKLFSLSLVVFIAQFVNLYAWSTRVLNSIFDDAQTFFFFFYQKKRE